MKIEDGFKMYNVQRFYKKSFLVLFDRLIGDLPNLDNELNKSYKCRVFKHKVKLPPKKNGNAIKYFRRDVRNTTYRIRDFIKGRGMENIRSASCYFDDENSLDCSIFMKIGVWYE